MAKHNCVHHRDDRKQLCQTGTFRGFSEAAKAVRRRAANAPAARAGASRTRAPARLLAIPGVRELIAAGPAKESWAITPDHAMCIFTADTTLGWA